MLSLRVVLLSENIYSSLRTDLQWLRCLLIVGLCSKFNLSWLEKVYTMTELIGESNIWEAVLTVYLLILRIKIELDKCGITSGPQLPEEVGLTWGYKPLEKITSVKASRSTTLGPTIGTVVSTVDDVELRRWSWPKNHEFGHDNHSGSSRTWF